MPTIVRFEDIEAWQTARESTNRIFDWHGMGSLPGILANKRLKAAI
jgi:hypothetical protein